MKQMKPNKVLITSFVFALLLTVTCAAPALSRDILAGTGSPTATDVSDIHSIESAGIQFELPKGWNAETKENGNVVVSFEDGACTVTFMVEDNYTAVVTGMKSGLKEHLTEMKLDGAAKENVHNGLAHISETGSGKMEGSVDIVWSIDVLKATHNVTMLTFGIEPILHKHIEEYKSFVASIRKS